MILKLWQVIKPGDGLIKQGAAWTEVLEYFTSIALWSASTSYL